MPGIGTRDMAHGWMILWGRSQRLQKQKTPVPEEKYEEQKSLERYVLEKRTKLLIKLPEARQYVIKLLEE